MGKTITNAVAAFVTGAITYASTVGAPTGKGSWIGILLAGAAAVATNQAGLHQTAPGAGGAAK